MDSNLYLTADEMVLFRSFPLAMQKEWKDRLVEETSDAYETDEELQSLIANANFDELPGVKEFKEKVASSSSPSTELLSDFPEDALPAFLQSIGACGISALIEIALRSGKVDAEGMRGLSAFSIIRHNILLRNAAMVA